MMTGTFDLGRVTGFSAYEVWKAQPGNENKTEQDFLKFISSGGDWIDFDTTPIDLKTVRDYKTYGSIKNLMDSDNLQDDGFVEMIAIINIYSDSNDATFSFESVSTPNNVLTGPDSPIYDVIQTLSVFTNAKSYKFVRRAQFNDSSKEVFITHAWECWEENGAAHKLADLFSITIGDVTKKTDGTNDVEFTKEELGLEGGSSGYFENIFNGYSPSARVKIGVAVHEAQLESPRLKGDVFLIQLAPTIVKTKVNVSGLGAVWLPASDSEETFAPFYGEVADYSTLLLVSTMNIANERKQPGGYQSYNNYNYSKGGLYNSVIKTEKLISLNGNTYRDVSNGTFITVKVQVDNSGVAWFDAIRPIGMPVFITNIWRLK